MNNSFERLNTPSKNPIVETARQKLLHVTVNFGTDAFISRAYRRIFDLLPEDATSKHLKSAIKKVTTSVSRTHQI